MVTTNPNDGVNKKILTPEQRKEASAEMVKSGLPVRFQHHGRSLNIISGELDPSNSNVMYQTVYWNFNKSTSKKIAKWLGVKAVFDKDESEPII